MYLVKKRCNFLLRLSRKFHLLGTDIHIDVIWWQEIILIVADIRSLIKHYLSTTVTLVVILSAFSHI